MKYWITKYALTQGIFELEAEDRGDEMIKGKGYDYFHAGEFFSDKENAIKKAELMREKKIKSVEKQLQKLKEMKF